MSRSLEVTNHLRFRARIDSSDGRDAHRAFTGVYYPRWRALFLDEVQELTGGKVRLLPILPFDVYLNSAGDHFFTADFFVGAELLFSTKGHSRDAAPKTYVVTSVDTSKLRTETYSGLTALDNKSSDVPQPVFETLKKVREAFAAHCGDLSLKAMGRRFRIMDHTGSRRVNKEGFALALKDVRVNLSSKENDDVFAAFDANHDGSISYDELLTVLRGPMSHARKALIQSIFAQLDRDKDGFVSLNELLVKFNAQGHRDVASGALTEAQAAKSFAAVWDTHDRNGLVSFAEFCDYYNTVSASIDTDEQFEAIVRSAWKL